MDVLERIRKEIRELLLNHGGSIRTDVMPQLYLKRYGKLLNALKVLRIRCCAT
jgi:hypothetical protein